MIESVKIQNFRGFSELEVHGLKPINIIVGENASGKSALLEAMFISSGPSPQVTFQLRAWRRFGGQIFVQTDLNAYRELWEDLFHGFDDSLVIDIEAIGASGDTRSLRIWYGNESSQILPFGQQSQPTPLIPQINFQWKGGDKEPALIRPKLTGTGLEFDLKAYDHFPTVLFAPYVGQPPDESAKRFSALSKDGREQSVVDSLKAEFPFLRSLSVEYSSSIPSVFAEVEGQRRKFPVGLISDGVNKLLSILLGIASFPNGTVLIDQIEDGFYFKKLPSIWRIIHKFANDNKTQIFATTHSKECLDALLPVLEANEGDFALLRAIRSDDSTTFSVINGRRFGSALSQEFELR